MKLNKRVLKHYWKTVWHFIWEDDSPWSWVANILIAFVLIKFVVYPVLGFLLSTSFPIVAVVSGSMEHEGSFDDWWSSPATCLENTIRCSQADHYSAYGISKEEFRDFPFKNGFNKGDIMILYGTKPEKIELGDVIVFAGDRPDPIIHRVVALGEGENRFFYRTKGDHNPTSLAFESVIPEDGVFGNAKVRIPFVGYVKIWFVQLIQMIRGIF